MATPDRRIFLHLGLHKTATTHLQWALNSNRAHLAERGFLYPETSLQRPENPTATDAASGHSAFHNALMSREDGPREALMDRLLAEIEASGAHTVILSSENFLTPPHAMPPSQLQHAFGRLGLLRPLVYLRRQDRLAESLYTELLGWSRLGLTDQIGPFLRSEAGCAWLDLDTRLAPLGQFFGNRLIVRSYDDLRGSNGVLEDVCQLIGLEQVPQVPQRTVYASVNPAMVNLLRQVNMVPGLSVPQRRRLVFQIKNDPRFAASEEEQGNSLLSDRAWARLALRYGDRNRRMARTMMAGGPVQNFRFPETRPEVRPCRQRYPMRRAAIILSGLMEELGIVPGADTDGDTGG